MMGESSERGNLHVPSRLGEIEGGGHIIRATGRKDRHSKVCTAKGPRDRRVRLAAHTAIQFYDVQDRLGYDRPSKAVDWLIKKAKAAIDELPAWKPTKVSFEEEAQKQEEQQYGIHGADSIITHVSGKRAISMLESEDINVRYRNVQNESFLPQSLDTSSMSFFPLMGASTETSSSSSMQFPPEFLSRISTHSQDLKLSLHPHSQAQVFLGGTPVNFDAWQEHHLHAAKSPSLRAGGAAVAAGYMLGSQRLLGQHQFYSQRGTLQSRNTPSVRAWMDPIADADHNTHPSVRPVDTSSMSSINGFASGEGGFPEFHVPSRNQEKQFGYSKNPSSDSRHQV